MRTRAAPRPSSRSRSATRSWTRASMSSRAALTSSGPRSTTGGMSQRIVCRAVGRSSSATPRPMTTSAADMTSSVTGLGKASGSSMPRSRMASSTSGDGPERVEAGGRGDVAPFARGRREGRRHLRAAGIAVADEEQAGGPLLRSTALAGQRPEPLLGEPLGEDGQVGVDRGGLLEPGPGVLDDADHLLAGEDPREALEELLDDALVLTVTIRLAHGSSSVMARRTHCSEAGHRAR